MNEAGADLNAVGSFGRRPIDLAKEMGDEMESAIRSLMAKAVLRMFMPDGRANKGPVCDG